MHQHPLLFVLREHIRKLSLLGTHPLRRVGQGLESGPLTVLLPNIQLLVAALSLGELPAFSGAFLAAFGGFLGLRGVDSALVVVFEVLLNFDLDLPDGVFPFVLVRVEGRGGVFGVRLGLRLLPCLLLPRQLLSLQELTLLFDLPQPFQLLLGDEVVLLVGVDDVADQRTLFGEEEAGNVHGLGVPHLRVLLGDCGVLLLRQKPQLSPQAEVRHHKQNDLLQHGVFVEFMGAVLLGGELISVHGGQVHDVADVQVEDPVITVFDPQDIPHIQLELVVVFEEVDLGFLLEGDLELFLGFFLLAFVELVPLPLAETVHSPELVDDPHELADHWLHLHNHRLQHLGLLLHIVSFVGIDGLDAGVRPHQMWFIPGAFLLEIFFDL
eukprot:CAMPEP_0170548312 /NCGR_PEP_ID=MMETSP0211-20121228/6640_1 /TAXON_ID=311385 /ORGANISM="Pseudokeronopsis sp., Strain OXSARD2" /LENGTH=380 /DNA_ID=CAMNT_0010853801 /DNA_START=666 /DNA_END=1808 /DNA_ORIENTATION=-